MIDISTKYLGFTLKSPIIVGSCGLTNSLEDIKLHAENGAGAVVLKSLFEEEIMIELEHSKTQMNQPGNIYPEIYDFFDFDTVEDSLTKYLNLIQDCKKHMDIPIIASINCVSADEWVGFAKRIQKAGADALELNLFILPSDFNRTAEENEKVYFDVINKIKSQITIPVALKVSYYFSNLGSMLQKLSESGIEGLVLFNRFYSPDFNIDNFTVTSTNVFSNPSDLPISLRWIAIMAERVKCDLAASTGVHDASSLIKQLLAGANAVQVVSALYKSGPGAIQNMLKGLMMWMEDQDFKSIDDFRGKMSQSRSKNPAVYERAQFMQHFSGKF
jgi:dihydroorotate dehydrogenase (fumarate)